MKLKILIVLVFLTAAFNLLSFDNVRKGFILGYGLGISGNSFWHEYQKNDDFLVSETKQKFGIGSEFKIGYSPNNFIEIYYSGNFSRLAATSKFSEKLAYYSVVSGVGLSYFVSSKLTETNDWTSSFFVSSGFGFSSWATLSAEYEKEQFGPGYFIGLGYEFKPHYRVSISLYSSNPSSKESGYVVSTKSTFLLMSVGFLAF